MSTIWILLILSIVIPVLLLLWMLRGSPHTPRRRHDKNDDTPDPD